MGSKEGGSFLEKLGVMGMMNRVSRVRMRLEEFRVWK